MAWSWYAVKTVYRWVASGKAHGKIFSDLKATLLEERVVLIRARNTPEAIRKAKSEASKYSGQSFKNIYGERIRHRLLRACDAYELFDSLGNNAEVWYSNRLIPRSVSDKMAVEMMVSPSKRPGDSNTRLRFLRHDPKSEITIENLLE